MEDSQNYLQRIAITKSDTKDMDYHAAYADSDIIIFDNIKIMAEPEMARLQMNMLAVCGKGKAELSLNGRKIHLRSGQILLSPSNTLLSDIMISPDFEFRVIFISNHMLQTVLNEKMRLWTDFVYRHQISVTAIDSDELRLVSQLEESTLLWLRSEQKYAFSNEVRQSIIRACMLAIFGIMQSHLSIHQVTGQPGLSGNVIFQKFINLLQTTPQKHHTVDYYSSKLFITPKYLSAVCKKHSGQSANDWIREYVLEDIRYYLKHTDYSIKEICNLTGFPNASFFGKYVKAHFGMSPGQFRKA